MEWTSTNMYVGKGGGWILLFLIIALLVIGIGIGAYLAKSG